MHRAMGVALGLLLATAAQGGNYTIGVEALDYYPHYRADARGQFDGFARAVFDAFAEDSGHVFSYRPLPVNRLYAEFAAGQVDFKYPDNPQWGGDAKKGVEVRYSASVTPYVDGLLVLPAAAGKGAVASIGIVAGFTPFPYKDALAEGRYKLEERNALDQLLRGVLLGRLDAAYVNIDVGRHALRTLGEPGGLVFDAAMPADRGDYHLSSIKHAEVLGQFDEWLKANAERITALRKQFALDP